MKLLIASDIHGSACWCRKVMDQVEAVNPDKVILLGDLLYHGPRNPLPDDYNPQEVADMLNSIADRIVAVRGNCDSEVDQMVLSFPCMADYSIIMDGLQLELFATHGHIFGPDNVPPLAPGSILLSGHTHIKTNEFHDDIYYVNPGSVSLPKDGSHSIALYQEGSLAFITLD